MQCLSSVLVGNSIGPMNNIHIMSDVYDFAYMKYRLLHLSWFKVAFIDTKKTFTVYDIKEWIYALETIWFDT